ncbi:MAG: hypothetical protein E6Q59_10185 [Nitrosomonas sp.]|nr:MAG: hypothetical protein BVN30_09705 [Proteobacteria bacterium ST_bin16]TXI35943.1 MAG: hypothetical protein E6Q59_10185 [Nitrosomonas sp.]
MKVIYDAATDAIKTTKAAPGKNGFIIKQADVTFTLRLTRMNCWQIGDKITKNNDTDRYFS